MFPMNFQCVFVFMCFLWLSYGDPTIVIGCAHEFVSNCLLWLPLFLLGYSNDNMISYEFAHDVLWFSKYVLGALMMLFCVFVCCLWMSNHTWCIWHIKYMTHDADESWNHMMHITHDVYHTLCVWHMMYMTHDAYDIWCKYNTMYMTYEVALMYYDILWFSVLWLHMRVSYSSFWCSNDWLMIS